MLPRQHRRARRQHPVVGREVCCDVALEQIHERGLLRQHDARAEERRDAADLEGLLSGPEVAALFAAPCQPLRVTVRLEEDQGGEEVLLLDVSGLATVADVRAAVARRVTASEAAAAELERELGSEFVS